MTEDASQQLVTFSRVLQQYKEMIAYKKQPNAVPYKHNRWLLFDLRWNRCILDESQNIRNPKGKITAACLALRKKFGYCLSATPVQVRESISLLGALHLLTFVQNTLMDLYPQMAFMGVDHNIARDSTRFDVEVCWEMKHHPKILPEKLEVGKLTRCMKKPLY